jgi:hypothetical protein
VDVCELLLQHGADVDARSHLSKETPLFVAVANGHADVVLLLLANGADASLTDRWQATALHYAPTALTADLVVQLGRCRVDVLDCRHRNPPAAVHARCIELFGVHHVDGGGVDGGVVMSRALMQQHASKGVAVQPLTAEEAAQLDQLRAVEVCVACVRVSVRLDEPVCFFVCAAFRRSCWSACDWSVSAMRQRARPLRCKRPPSNVRCGACACVRPRVRVCVALVCATSCACACALQHRELVDSRRAALEEEERRRASRQRIARIRTEYLAWRRGETRQLKEPAGILQRRVGTTELLVSGAQLGDRLSVTIHITSLCVPRENLEARRRSVVVK